MKSSASYARYLANTPLWKRVLDVQAPYRWHIRSLDLGFTLDVGCGVGRNLSHLGGNGIGVDLDPECVGIASARGLTAYTLEDFENSPYAKSERFDSLLFAHVLEHMDFEVAKALVHRFIKYLRPEGRAVFITPQEKGYSTDQTHRNFFDFQSMQLVCAEEGLALQKTYSFPFPRPVGRLFAYNEFVGVAIKSFNETT